MIHSSRLFADDTTNLIPVFGMIHPDANVLIRLSVPGSGAAKTVRQWLLAG
jgi:hypothetical protein